MNSFVDSGLISDCLLYQSDKFYLTKKKLDELS
jgi:hypothetical protein